MPEETYQCPVCKKQRSPYSDPPITVGVKREVWRGCSTCYDTLWAALIGLAGKLPVL